MALGSSDVRREMWVRPITHNTYQLHTNGSSGFFVRIRYVICGMCQFRAGFEARQPLMQVWYCTYS